MFSEKRRLSTDSSGGRSGSTDSPGRRASSTAEQPAASQTETVPALDLTVASDTMIGPDKGGTLRDSLVASPDKEVGKCNSDDKINQEEGLVKVTSILPLPELRKFNTKG